MFAKALLNALPCLTGYRPQSSQDQPRGHVQRRLRHNLSATLMNDDTPAPQSSFLETKEYRQFTEFCDACRQQRYFGLCHGLLSVGKTVLARRYAQWQLIQPYFPERFYDTYRRLWVEQ